MSKPFTWGFLIAAVIVVFIAFNYQNGQDAVPLSEIFPDENSFPADVEYEFVQDESSADVIDEPIEVAEARVVTEAPSASKQIESTADANINNLSFSPSPVTSGKEFNFTVQIASFKERKRAEDALAQIRSKVPTAYIGVQDLGSKGVWHRVYAGQYELRNDAEVALSAIKQKYDSSFIISPNKTK